MEGTGLGVEDHVLGGGLQQLGHHLTGRLHQLVRGVREAVPASCTERDPTVRPPAGTRSVSPCTISTSSIATPSRSATIIDHTVSWPWPNGVAPLTALMRPSGCSSTEPYSDGGAGAVIST